MSYPDGTVPTDRTVHPTPVYETLAMGLGAWILWQLRDRFRAGVLFAIYLIYAGAERFLVEFLRRNDDRCPGPDHCPVGEPGDDGSPGRSGSPSCGSRHGSLSRVAATDPIRPVAGL